MIYYLSFICGILLKIGDDMLDIYNYKHGDFWPELIKVILTISFTILILKYNNIWGYYSLFGIWALSILAPHQYFEDNYAKALTISFTILPLFYIISNFRYYKISSIIIANLIYSILVIPFFIQDITFWYDIFNIKVNNWVYEEVGVNKLIIRSLLIVISIIMIFIVNKYQITSNLYETKFNIGYTSFSLFMIGYFSVSVINQIYNLYFNKKYTKHREECNKLKNKKQILKYKNKIYDIFTPLLM